MENLNLEDVRSLFPKIFSRFEGCGVSATDIIRVLDEHGWDENGVGVEKALENLANGMVVDSNMEHLTPSQLYGTESSTETGEGVSPSTTTTTSNNVSDGGDELSSMSTTTCSDNENEEEEDDDEEENNELDVEEIIAMDTLDTLGEAESIGLVEEAHSDEEDDGIRYLVRFTGYSYCHVEWVASRYINKRKLAAFRKKYEEETSSGAQISLSLPITVEKVLEDRGSEGFLVKWKGLHHDRCTIEHILEDEHILELQVGGLKAMKALVADMRRRTKPITKQSIASLKALAKKIKARKPMSRKALAEYFATEAEEETESEGVASEDEDTVYNKKNALQLRPYQQEGVFWLCYNWQSRRNSILADEMGLGKTAQVIIFLQRIFEILGARSIGPALVVVPLSTVQHWIDEVTRWTDLTIVVLGGSKMSRDVMFESEWDRKTQGSSKDRSYQFDIVVTTYSLVSKEIDKLRAVEWSCVVVDEAQRIKAGTSRLREDLSILKTDSKVLMTGTPVNNDLEELLSLFRFLHSDGRFEVLNEDVDATKSVDMLHQVLKPLQPYMLRRIKKDVAKELKPLKETVVFVELTPKQRSIYRAIYEQNASLLIPGFTNAKTGPSFCNVHMQLRKCCNHPFLVRGVEEAERDRLKAEGALPLSKYSGKLILLEKLLPKLKKEGHRVLIFSQFKMMLDLLEEVLHSMDEDFERVDGDTKSLDRQVAIDRFNCSSGEDATFAFLLSTRAGGVGINLQAADTVIIFDSDWNPQQDVQAQSRAHRIGQQRTVAVYRLVTARTYETELFRGSSMKLGLEKAINSSIVKSEAIKQPNKKEMESLLKRGAYGAFDDNSESANKAEEFGDMDIDRILSAYSVDMVRDEPCKGGQFSVARFVTPDEEAAAAEEKLQEQLQEMFHLETAREAESAAADLRSRKERASRKGFVPTEIPRAPSKAKVVVNRRSQDPLQDLGAELSSSDEESESEEGPNDDFGPSPAKRMKEELPAAVDQLTIKELKAWESALARFGICRIPEARRAAGIDSSRISDDTLRSCTAVMLALTVMSPSLTASDKLSAEVESAESCSLAPALSFPGGLAYALLVPLVFSLKSNNLTDAASSKDSVTSDSAVPTLPGDNTNLKEPEKTTAPTPFPMPAVVLEAAVAESKIPSHLVSQKGWLTKRFAGAGGLKFLRRLFHLEVLRQEIKTKSSKGFKAPSTVKEPVEGAPTWSDEARRQLLDTFLLCGIYEDGWPRGSGPTADIEYERMCMRHGFAAYFSSSHNESMKSSALPAVSAPSMIPESSEVSNSGFCDTSFPPSSLLKPQTTNIKDENAAGPSDKPQIENCGAPVFTVQGDDAPDLISNDVNKNVQQEEVAVIVINEDEAAGSVEEELCMENSAAMSVVHEDTDCLSNGNLNKQQPTLQQLWQKKPPQKKTTQSSVATDVHTDNQPGDESILMPQDKGSFLCDAKTFSCAATTTSSVLPCLPKSSALRKRVFQLLEKLEKRQRKNLQQKQRKLKEKSLKGDINSSIGDENAAVFNSTLLNRFNILDGRERKSPNEGKRRIRILGDVKCIDGDEGVEGEMEHIVIQKARIEARNRAREAEKARKAQHWNEKSVLDFWKAFQYGSPPIARTPGLEDQWIAAFDWQAFATQVSGKASLSKRSASAFEELLEALLRHNGYLHNLKNGGPSTMGVSKAMEVLASVTFPEGNSVMSARLGELIQARLPACKKLNKVLETDEISFASLEKGRGLHVTWNAKADRDLLRGVQWHGHGARGIRAMSNDPSLIFDGNKHLLPKLAVASERMLYILNSIAG